jgi:hypothetical protein
MKTYSRLLGALAFVLVVAFSSRSAHALGPLDLEVGVKVGYGTNPIKDAPVNPLGFGVGGRAGVSILGLYLGANAVNYFGSGDRFGGLFRSFEVGGEVGYGIKLPLITIRPQVGLGNITFSDSIGLTPSLNSFYVEPGVTVLIPFAIFFIAGDANALIITDTPNSPLGTGNGAGTAFTVHGQFGIRL